jgi:hypothetical protein
MGGSNDPPLLSKADRILGRVGILAGFNLDEDEDFAVPGDDVHFAEFRAIGGGHDAVAEPAQMIDREKLGSAPELEKAVEKQRKGHRAWNQPVSWGHPF